VAPAQASAEAAVQAKSPFTPQEPEQVKITLNLIAYTD
jgi:hypothetical protein